MHEPFAQGSYQQALAGPGPARHAEVDPPVPWAPPVALLTPPVLPVLKIADVPPFPTLVAPPLPADTPHTHSLKPDPVALQACAPTHEPGPRQARVALGTHSRPVKVPGAPPAPPVPLGPSTMTFSVFVPPHAIAKDSKANDQDIALVFMSLPFVMSVVITLVRSKLWF